MNKKRITAVISIVCLLLMGTVAVGVLYKNGMISSNNLYTQVKTNGSAAASPASGKQTRRFCPGVLLKEGASYALQYSQGATVAETKYYDILYQVNSIEVTKKRGDFDKCEDWDETKDSSGNITNEYSYVVVNMTVQDQWEKEDIFGVNDIRLVLGKDATGGEELRSYNSQGVNPIDKQYFILSLKPNQKYNFTLAYIVKDEDAQKHKNDMMVYCVGSHGHRPPSLQELPIVDKDGTVTVRKESGS